MERDRRREDDGPTASSAARRRGSTSPTRQRGSVTTGFAPPSSAAPRAAAAARPLRARRSTAVTTLALASLLGVSLLLLLLVPLLPPPSPPSPGAPVSTPATTTAAATRRRALLQDGSSAAAAATTAAATTTSAPSETPHTSNSPHHPHHNQQPPALLDLAARCHGADGQWCASFYTQRPLPPRAPPPLHNTPCPNDCSRGLGVCHADTGRCDCPAGWRGADCSERDPRPCTNAYRSSPADPTPASHVGPDGRDLDIHAPGFTYSRCGGVCDTDTGACYCDGEAHGRVNAPAGEGVAPGTPPLREGRPLATPCAWLSTDAQGKALGWGGPPGVPWQALYGPRGWCTVEAGPAQVSCGCALDGRGGALCDLPTERVCPNQCSGHGECLRGFCRCAEGWYGLDCARKAAAVGATAVERRRRQEGGGGEDGGVGGRSSSSSTSSSISERQDGPPPLLPHDVDVVGERPWLEEVTVDPWSRAQVPTHALVEAAAQAAAAAAVGDATAATTTAPEADLALALEDDQFLAATVHGGDNPAALSADAIAEALVGGGEQQDEAGPSAAAAPANRRRQRQRRHLTRHFWTGAGAGPWRPPSKRLPPRRPGAPDLPPSSPSNFGSDSATAIAGLQEWGGRSLSTARRASGARARAAGQRLRPRIFVYDMPSAFVSRPLQYRAARERCAWRVFGAGSSSSSSSSSSSEEDDASTTAAAPKGLRGGGALNASDFSAYPYATESLLHELLLRSEHRTLDPESADLFYVPIYSSCFIDGVFGAADTPWWHSPSKSRVKGASVMVAAALAWIKETYPYWQRHQGRDHVWLFPHDEGACWAPSEILSSSIVLTSWGRTGGGNGGWARGGKAGKLPVSEAADPQLNYTINIGDDPRLGVGGVDLLIQQRQQRDEKKKPPAASSWHDALGVGTQPCHDAASGRHLVVPAFRPPPHYHGSPYLGAPEPRNAPRDVLMLLMGETGVELSPSSSSWRATRPASFSRGVRQRLARAAHEGKWRERHGIWIGGPKELAAYAAAISGLGQNASALLAAAEAEAAAARNSNSYTTTTNLAGASGALVAAATSADADYSRMLARSVFCLVAPEKGGWTGLFEDAVLHGCVPVWMHDAVRPPFDGALRWRDFALELREADAERLPELLAAVPPARIAEMQRRLALLWHRYAWLSHPLLRRAADEGLLRNHRRGEWIVPALELHAAAGGRRPAVGAAVGVAPLPGDGGGTMSVGKGRGKASAALDRETGAAAAAIGGPERWISPLDPAEAQDDAFATILQWLYSRIPDVMEEAEKAEAKASSSSSLPSALLPPHRRAIAPWEATLSSPSAAVDPGPTVRQPDLVLESDGPFADEGTGGVGAADPDAPGGTSGARPEGGAAVLARLSAAEQDKDALEVALFEGEPLLDDGRGGALLVRHGEDPLREQREKADARFARLAAAEGLATVDALAAQMMAREEEEGEPRRRER